MRRSWFGFRFGLELFAPWSKRTLRRALTADPLFLLVHFLVVDGFLGFRTHELGGVVVTTAVPWVPVLDAAYRRFLHGFVPFFRTWVYVIFAVPVTTIYDAELVTSTGAGAAAPS